MSGSRLCRGLRRLLRRRSADSEQGTAAVEMALVLPMFLLMIVGLVNLGHAYVVKYQLHNAAYNAARLCSLTNNVTSACVQQEVTQSLGGFRQSCGGSPTTTMTQLTTRGATGLDFDTAWVIQVDVDCSYTGIAGLAFLQSMGILTGPIQVSAALPY